ILLLSYFYYFGIGESYALVTIGLVSFMAAAQFAPAIIGGIFWKGATGHGAGTGLVLGFAIWIYTLLLPALALSGWLPIGFVEQGPAGIAWLRPYQLFGLTGLDIISHALFWSMLANIGGYVGVSLFTRQSDVERVQAALFVDVFRLTDAQHMSISWGGSASVAELRDLAARFLGVSRADGAFNRYMRGRGLDPDTQQVADADLIAYTERLLTGIIGSSSARVVVSSVAKGEFVGIDQVMEILDEASRMIRYSQEMEVKSRELERATSDLRAANARLRELDRLKDDFLSTISHELRTPLTSIRSFAEILADNRDLNAGQRGEFSNVIIRESERLTRLIDQILELSRLEAGRMEWRMGSVDLTTAIEQALSATQSLFADGQATLRLDLPNRLPLVYADHDRLIQVLVNLLSNAAKFCRRPGGAVALHVEVQPDRLLMHVDDNGPGVSPNQREAIFDRFHQAGETLTQKPAGTGLGLAICREIVGYFGGRIWVAPEFKDGARFSFTLPVAQPESLAAAGD
ncbi:MAG: ATP-binding protein, partial [Alphaproteobacteria bacterium]|nr:ATP-binding protein [Alphaproteobacteria bacterium]